MEKKETGAEKKEKIPADGLCEVTFWGVPYPIKQAFKTACARNGKSMKEIVVEFMTQYAKG